MTVSNRAINCLKRGLRGGPCGMGRPLSVPFRNTAETVRALTDADIRLLWQVGPAMEAEIREIRDTWTDEQLECCGFRVEGGPSPRSVEAYFAARPDVFSVIGG